MSKKDDTAPQQRLCQDGFMRFANQNRTMGFISPLSDINGKTHMLLLGKVNTTLVDFTDEDKTEEQHVADIKAFQKEAEAGFLIISNANPMLVVQLPVVMSAELAETLLGVALTVPTMFTYKRSQITMPFHGKMIIVPKSVFVPDFTVPQKLNWDSMKRVVEYLDSTEQWNKLDNFTSVGSFSIPDPKKSIIKVE